MPRGKAKKTLDLIGAAYAELAEIQPASVRAVCYRLFVRGAIPNMGKGSTDRVSRALTWAREQGIVPWAWIVDEARATESLASWDGLDAYADAVARSYRRDRWAMQPVRVEVWSEKGTVRGTLRSVLDRYAVPLRVMHGFTSTTVAHDVADASRRDARPFVAVYVGDFDPSGMYMSGADLPRRLAEYGAEGVTVERVALTAGDVADPTLALPGFSADDKRKDARHPWYVERYGRRCWELDALPPPILRERVERHVRTLIDWPVWERAEAVEAVERRSVRDLVGAWREAGR